ncbi:Lipid phosphate phosphatase, putative [Hondaea fermentalgiana]|uniref:Lipid phosphate phosphatase, putative n=1 Tax=Hondaea fermentalgiana TaxID=2315210 RepID=A0A2R5GL75_9STRA|nr:Lipid phosphate phosphatase, putative [Hondaea fermentalgiana]|eukprot:GBG31656.1 Lipid phosphate phosphatase, putative [Hondaea fermentalgiana]
MSPNASKLARTASSRRDDCAQQHKRRQQKGGASRRRQQAKSPKFAMQISRTSRKVLTQMLREASHLQIGHLEREFWAWDEHISGTVYSGTRRSPLLRTLCACLSISGDEALWFILPVVLASVMTIVQGGPLWMGCGNISCDMEFFLDLFGGMAVCAFVEQVLKLFFQRPRPTCRPYDNTYCCILGEGHSFPSGHSMRALYAFNWLFYSAHATFMLGLPHYLEPFVLVWALGVGYARVAAGRHHPIDVIVGDVVGLGISRVVENDISDRHRVLVKMFCGIAVAIQRVSGLLEAITICAVNDKNNSMDFLVMMAPNTSARGATAKVKAVYFKAQN